MVTFDQRMGSWPMSWLDSMIQLAMHGLIQLTCLMVDLMAMDDDCYGVVAERQQQPKLIVLVVVVVAD